MGSHNFKGAAMGVLRVMQRISCDIRFNIYISPDISRDILCNIYISTDVHVIVNIVAKNTRLVRTELDERLATTALDERLATTALDGTRTAFNARLATLHMRLVRTELDEGLATTALDDSNRQYARKRKTEKKANSQTILIHVLRNMRCCSFRLALSLIHI